MKTKANTMFRSGALCLCLAILAGCATDGNHHEVNTFDPIPSIDLGDHGVEPVKPKSAVELLRAAEGEFQLGNQAQEDGDQEAALRHYTAMLEHLVEADLDPTIFYNLRGEFSRILDSTSRQAHLFETGTGIEWADKNFSGVLVAKDIEIPTVLHERVLKEIEEIQEVYPRNFQNGLNRYAKYAPHIRSELAKAGLPTDLVWLAMVESQYAPWVTSRAGAGGMWQFMKATGERYGLRVDSYVDERYDWEKATQAACGYLKDLGERFDGEWSLALTAYNMGEYGMERAIASNGGERDLFKLIETGAASKRMQEETKKFYPKFLASMIVASNPQRFGFTMEPEAPDAVLRVPVEGSYSLATLEQACGLENGTLKRLNPGLIKGVTPPSGEYPVVVPADVSGIFIASLNRSVDSEIRTAYTPEPESSSSTYVVRRGETLSEIAKRHNVSLKELMDANKLRSARLVHVGKRLIIPGGQQGVVTVEAASTTSESGERMYRVKQGDTLFEIARRENVSYKDLQKFNNLTNTSRIKVGDVLRLSPGSGGSAPAQTGEISEDVDLAKVVPAAQSAVPAAPEPQKKTHVVKRGEYPSRIAAQYGVKLEDLLKWNKLSSRSTIRVGQKLTIYASDSGEAPVETVQMAALVEPASSANVVEAYLAPKEETKVESITHTVQRGEYPSRIAGKYGVKLNDLLAWNNLTSRSTIRPGQKLIIKKTGSGTTAASTPSRPEFHTVAKGDFTSTIAEKYGIPLSELLKMNGMTSRSVIRIGQKLRLQPEGQAQAAPVQVAKVEPATEPAPVAPVPVAEPAASDTTYTVQSGDFPATIAKKQGVALNDLLAWNNLTKDSMIRVGQKLIIKGGTTSGSTEIAKLAPAPIAETAPLTREHVVRKGEFPARIAKDYGVSVDDLLAWNNLDKSSTLRIGQKLAIKGGSTTVPAAPGATVKTTSSQPAPAKTHKVGSGESAWSIAQRYDVAVDDLLSWNNLTKSSTLRIGQTLVVQGAKGSGGSSSSSSAPAISTHEVKRGDNPTSIAQKYNMGVKDLFTLNGWSKTPVLQLGQKVKVQSK